MRMPYVQGKVQKVKTQDGFTVNKEERHVLGVK